MKLTTKKSYFSPPPPHPHVHLTDILCIGRAPRFSLSLELISLINLILSSISRNKSQMLFCIILSISSSGNKQVEGIPSPLLPSSPNNSSDVEGVPVKDKIPSWLGNIQRARGCLTVYKIELWLR